MPATAEPSIAVNRQPLPQDIGLKGAQHRRPLGERLRRRDDYVLRPAQPRQLKRGGDDRLRLSSQSTAERETAHSSKSLSGRPPRLANEPNRNILSASGTASLMESTMRSKASRERSPFGGAAGMSFLPQTYACRSGLDPAVHGIVVDGLGLGGMVHGLIQGGMIDLLGPGFLTK